MIRRALLSLQVVILVSACDHQSHQGSRIFESPWHGVCWFVDRLSHGGSYDEIVAIPPHTSEGDVFASDDSKKRAANALRSAFALDDGYGGCEILVRKTEGGAAVVFRSLRRSDRGEYRGKYECSVFMSQDGPKVWHIVAIACSR